MDWRIWPIDRLTARRDIALTSSRIRAAYAVAIATDVLQFALGPFGWAFSDEILDVLAMVATTRLLGFHPLLLPTFLLELAPIVDVLPTWTACTALVIALRKRQSPVPAPPDRHEGDTIDVKPTRIA